MKKLSIICSLCLACSAALASLYDPFLPKNEYCAVEPTLGLVISFAGGIGDETNAAIANNGKVWKNGGLSAEPVYEFAGWATGCASYNPAGGISGSGTDYGADAFTDPSKAFGRATGGDTSDVVVLGEDKDNPGSIVMTFDAPIRNGDGYDFAVFENSLDNTFLELAFVEVSTDGEHFVRFPNFYLGTSPVGSDIDAGDNDPTLIYNLGSKYMIGYGNGYDLQELADAYDYALAHWDAETSTALSSSVFSADYISDLLENYQYLDLESVNYVRIVDIYGDGSVLDSAGNPIYDACPTHGTPGFDLSGIGVINAGAAVPEPADFALALGIVCATYMLVRRAAPGRGRG